MAWAEERAPKQWRGVYRDRDGKKKTIEGSFLTKKAARDAAASAEVAANSHLGKMRAATSPTWGEWCTNWWPARAIEPATHVSESGMVNKHIAPRWADVKLEDITRLEVQQWVNDLPLAPESRRRVLGVFVSSLSAAVEHGVIDANPALRIKLPPRKQGREVFLTKDQFAALLHELPTQADRAVVKFLAGTGIRWGELAGLHWHNLDTSRGVVTVADVYSVGEIKPYPKGRRQRHVPYFPWAIEDLDVSASHLVCDVPHREGECRTGLVFHTGNGGALDDRNFSRRVLKPSLKRAGLEHLGATLHDLRHTYASWLAQAGIPLERIGELLGHASPNTTQIYAHLQPARHDELAAALSDIGGGKWGQNGGRVAYLPTNSRTIAETQPGAGPNKIPDQKLELQFRNTGA